MAEAEGPSRDAEVSSREAVLAAAVRVMARQGYAATRLVDVAGEAGLAEDAVRLWFGDREALLAAVFERYAALVGAALREAEEAPGSGLRRLGDLLRSILDGVAAQPELAAVLVDLWTHGRDGSGLLPMDMAAVYRDYRAAVAGLLAEGERDGSVRPSPDGASRERRAAVVVAMVEGCLVQWLMDETLELTSLTEPVVELCAAAVGGTGTVRDAPDAGADAPNPASSSRG